MSDLIQPSFSKGELSPELHGRVDVNAYGLGLAEATNGIVHTYGGISKRPGLKYVGPVKDRTKPPRLIPFTFSADDSYILEFGDKYIRFIRNGGPTVTGYNNPITDVTLSNGRITTDVSHNLPIGQEVLIRNIVGTTELNNGRFKVGTPMSDRVFTLYDQQTGNPVDTSGYTPYVSGGQVRKVYEIESPYAIEDVFQLNYVQSADVITLVHPNYPVYELQRNSNVDWVIAQVGFINTVSIPKSIVGTVKGSNTTSFNAINQDLQLQVAGVQKEVSVVITGTFVGTIQLQQQVGIATPEFKKVIATFTAPTVGTYTYTTGGTQEVLRLVTTAWTSGTATVVLQQDNQVRYIVTAVDPETGEESLPGTAVGLNITNISIALDAVFTTFEDHELQTGDSVDIVNITDGRLVRLNTGRYVVDTVVGPKTLTLNDEDGLSVNTSADGPYVTSGIDQIRPCFLRLFNVPVLMENTISWDTAFRGAKYNVYKEKDGIFGFIGQTNLLTFTDTNISPEVDLNPPSARNPFSSSEDYPGAVGYFEQRRVFGGTNARPDTSDFSQVGRQNNFSKSEPLRDDDAITATLTSDQINRIRHYVPLQTLLVLTEGSEWVIKSGPDSPFTGESIRQAPQSVWGTSLIKPLKLNNSAIFVTPDLANVRSIGYSFEQDAYTGANLNVLSRHLFRGHQVLDMCLVRNPDSRVYMCRDDGILLTLAYDQEQEVVAWTQWETLGKFSSCASVRGSETDEVYFVVTRINTGTGVSTVGIERFREPTIEDVADAFYVDAGLTYDNPITIEGTTAVTVDGVNTVRIISTNHGLSENDRIDVSQRPYIPQLGPFNEVVIKQGINDTRFKIVDVTSNNFRLLYENGTPVPASLIGGDIGGAGGVFRKAVITVTGLYHLEGMTVIALADGNVIDNLVVTNAKVALPRRFSRIQIGIPYISKFKTLQIEGGSPRGPTTFQGKVKNIYKVICKFFSSNGGFVGTDEMSLQEIKWRTDELMGNATRLYSGDKSVIVNNKWEQKGQIVVVNPHPLPLTLLAVIPHFELEDD